MENQRRMRIAGVSAMAAIAAALVSVAGAETKTIDLLPGEYWWGGTVGGGWRMPVGEKGKETLDLRIESDGNQAAPLLLSTKGRWVWCEDAFKYEFKDGVLTVETGPSPRRKGNTPHPMDVETAETGVDATSGATSSQMSFDIPNLAKTCYSKKTFAPIETGRAGDSLRTAFEYCSRTYFPPRGMCSPVWIQAPMLNTWVELNYNQNEKDILAYAKSFKDNGLADGGIFQIDCFWQTDSFGLWKFHGDRFDDPKGMVKKLNEMGFHVILWYAPFVTMDQMPYRYLRQGDGILKDARLIAYAKGYQGLPIQWWDGYSAVYDPTSPFGRDWNRKTMKRIMDEYGVEGFFFDGGGTHEYPPGDYIAHDSTAQPYDLCRAFQMMATEVPLGQCREAWKMGGLPLMQTLRDKAPKWSEMRRCITDMIAAGQLGYPFTVADLIGGGTCGNSGTGVHGLDWQSELFIRHMQIECLSPIMMFSGSPWRLFDAKTQEIVRRTLKLRDRFAPKFLKLAEETGRTGLPMLRSMDFQFPGCGYELVLDQFMMGDDLLVAPVVEGGAKTRKVVVPSGTWKADDGSVVIGPKTIDVTTPLDRLPYLERQSETDVATNAGGGRAADPGAKDYKSMGETLRSDEREPIGFEIAENRKGLVYSLGEEVVFTVTATNGSGGKALSGSLKVTVSDYTVRPGRTHEVDLSRENPFVMRGTMTEPGFLRFEIEGEGATKTVRGAAFAPERIRAAGTCPKDFDAFWSEAKAKLAREVPLDPRLVHVPERSTDKFDFWRVSFATFGGQRVWGFLTVPKDRSKAPFPVRFSISSAGTGRWTWDFESARYQDVVINMSFTVHRFEPPTNQADADRLHKRLAEELKAECGVGSYPVAGLGKSREDVYFYRPILGIDRAVDWLWSRPDVDRHRFIYRGGSQGGGLGMILLGLNHRFTAALLHVPAMMDMLGSDAGRECGFPYLEGYYGKRADRDAAFANAAYFNGAFFAARVTCPVRISMGFIDNVCPPTGVYAGYNALRVKDRQILHGLYRAHGWWPEAEVWEEWLRCDNGNRENQKRRTE